MLGPHAIPRPMDQTNAYGHSRSRTTSSSVFPMQQQPASHYPQAMPPHMQNSRRSPSVNTFSTTSSMQPPAAYRTSSSTDLRRSISSRSTGTTAPPSSYVALLRRQKATVWCDRAQYEDPRVAAQQKAAKVRANLEVVGGGRGTITPSRTNTGISATGKVAAKIRHHGKTPVVGYAPGDTNHVGVGGVPLRLSATEVEGESSDDDDAHAASRAHHRRTGSSGRSSIGSGRRGLQYRVSGSSVTIGGHRRSPGGTPERTGSLIERPEEAMRTISDSASGRAQSSRSTSSGERADNLGELGSNPKLAPNSQKLSVLVREKSVKSADELKRRGSVDERTATLTSGRLFIANPD
ncbi:uncharacterized protein MAM_00438 [Metarhizium album ARSEF 1941]|uniref:Uncharacterized protein n=1 Tax=Metarhizium album (strain ARSEF 1941) TaxID=1081103 RepID=A0A0B2WYT1_METAS|nr:uncharacterized protein MAM_00438 [Metarhizium album ARSEF 1941]KHO01437.1 hypothetical protein MAM_00438 [Metarhizium album ARSEF 1941]